MNRALLFCVLLSCALAPALADGLPLKNGRYEGPAIVLNLTTEQKAAIDHFRTCHLQQFKTMNQYTPYVFTLTADQAKVLRAKKGFVPRYFQIYETYTGYNDAGPHWNLALRFKEDQIEIPIDLIIPDKEAKKAEGEQGWKSKNPCFPKLGKVTSNMLLDAEAFRPWSA
jgi:hypothetical protein